MSVRAVLTAAVLLVVAACGGEAPQPVEKVTLTWWDHLNHTPMADQGADALIKRYQDAHPGVEIRRTSIPPAEFDARLAEAVAAGAFPDIAAVDVTALPRLAEQEVLADLTPRFEGWAPADRYPGPVRDGVRHRDRFWGVPLRTTTTALLYNRDLFTAAGVARPPDTWEELRATARSLTTPEHAGLCFAAAAGDDLTVDFLPFLWQAGGDLTGVGDDASLRALSFVDELVNVDRVAPAAVLGWTAADAEREFAAGRCGMVLAGPRAVPAANTAGLDWGAAPLPAGRAGRVAAVGGDAWVLGRAGQHVDRAWDVLRWLAEERGTATEFGAAMNAVPNRSDTVDDPGWRWDANVPAFSSQLAGARAVRDPDYAQVSEAVWTMVRQVLGRERTPGEAAADARARLEPLLR
ncbi:ABC transporter substrate-binding protein [Saccharothrix obliqua]|uniref:ABC transporter substrate-binding protein n=1 Tax=Saccharothrix obliqua TaxID=2861747 RepID=UPI001C5FF530|nr:sugar ABC transporter substrate-binding protein [Saccharothrix obliqua]MBW4716937.1 sugar ABC transporter substrate-binding protein [Saccharothrix obliqua]